MALATIVATLTTITACRRGGAPDAKAKPGAQRGGPVPVIVAHAAEKSMPVEIKAIGNVLPFTKVSVRSRITGELARVHFQEGQEVHQGELLFTIDPRPAQAALQQLEGNLARDRAQADNARAEFDREKKLFDSGLVSRDEYEKAGANRAALDATVLADTAAVSNAALNVEYTTIRSPVEGRTGNVLVHEGNVVKSEDDVLVVINQVRPIFVSFAVPEQNLATIRAHMAQNPLSVEVVLPDATNNPPDGQLTFVDNSVDPTTATIQLKATFQNERNLLWPGQFVQVGLRLDTKEHAVVVPSPAVQNGQEGRLVYVVKADQTIEVRPVVEGLERDGLIVIEKGIRPGETVVTDGQLRLVPGSKVSVKAPVALAREGRAPTNSP
jgi:multidrug efflux system membrane fusion protein